MIKIDGKLLQHINNPELAEIFARPDVQNLLLAVLNDIHSNYDALKKLLEFNGDKMYFDKIIGGMKNSFIDLKSKVSEKEITFQKIRRAYDGKIFKIGDEAIQIIGGVEKSLGTIGRMYVNYDQSYVLHIGINPEKNSVTWRELKDLV